MQTTTDTQIGEAVGIRQRISVSLIAISLSLISLSLSVALFATDGAVLFAAPDTGLLSTPSTATAVTLTWTAPGDDGAIGTATMYDVRVAEVPITDLNFTSTTPLPNLPGPELAGTTQSYTATGLTPSTTYYFALKTIDENNNISELSNVTTKTTSALAVACVPTYSCDEWSSCVEGLRTRTCTVTNGCSAGLDQPASSQICGGADDLPPPETGTGGATARLNHHIIAVGTGPGTRPLVRVVTPATGKVTKEFAPFVSTEKNGTNIAAGELTGDRQPDIIVGTGAGTSAKVKVYTDRGAKQTEVSPYPVQRGTGVAVAAGDVNGDGRDEVITVPAKGTSQVKVFQYETTSKKLTVLAQGFAFNRRLLNGWSVASADLTLDGRAEIIVAPRTNGRTVSIWNVTTANTLRKISSFVPYPLTSSSGLTVATGDINGDGRPEILTTLGPGYWSHVKAFDLQGRVVASFEPTSRSWLGAVSLTALDVNQDGRDEVIAGPYNRGEPRLRVFRYNGATRKFSQVTSYLVYSSLVSRGLRLGSI